MSRHADLILASVATDAATSAVATSWRRSATVHALDPDERSGPPRDDAALKNALDRDGRMVATARPYIDELFALLGPGVLGTGLTDAAGVLVAMRSGSTHDAWKRRPDQFLGTSLNERHVGTNGVGTALAEERPMTIEANEHFLAILSGTTCMSAPIFGPDGRLAGCLNATMHAAGATGALPTLIQMAVSGFARRIELELFAAAFPDAGLRLVSRQGHHPGAVMAVDDDHYVVGATRQARRLLDLDDGRIAKGFNLRASKADPPEALETAERRIIAVALARCDGNVSKAARAIGISRSTLYRKAYDLLPRRRN